MLMACTSFDNLFRGQDNVMYQNSYQPQGEGNLVTAGIYSLLIPTREGEIQQDSCNVDSCLSSSSPATSPVETLSHLPQPKLQEMTIGKKNCRFPETGITMGTCIVAQSASFPALNLRHQWPQVTMFATTPSSVHTTSNDDAAYGCNFSTHAQTVQPVSDNKELELHHAFLCDFPGCKKRCYTKSYHLGTDRRIYRGKKPFLCPWENCGWCFRRSDELKRHYRRHTGEKPYVCSLCGRSFSRSDHRSSHIKKIHPLM
ncbi:Krueppel-like factor 5 [Montipora capricornis]|uniref:Krueppel-like factor 5 n=1 Tax=Montipora capricornis TaxID=246305 RepID=UPI0035F145EA